MITPKQILTGFGPSKVKIIEKNNYKIVRKIFPNKELDRRNKEMDKLKILKGLSTPELFNVPTVLDSGEENGIFYYDLEYIKNAHELADCGFIFSSKSLVDRINNIIKIISSYESPVGNVWEIMLEKFKALKTEDKNYNELINNLPLDIKFNCVGYSHGDLSFDNILYADKKLYLIDPAWSKVESPLWDVGKIMQSVLINWGKIKNTGRALGCERDGWLTALIYSGSALNSGTITGSFCEKYGIDAVILSTACQLSRVSRWCFPEVLIPIINRLLSMYLNERIDHVRFDALCRVI